MINKRIRLITSHPLISGSSIVLVGTFIGNIMQYIFNILMLSLLSKPDYGLLITLTSIINLLAILQGALSSIFAKFAAQYEARKDATGLNNLISGGKRFVLEFALSILVVLFMALQPLAKFLHITDIRLMLLAYFAICIAILFSLPMGILQGRMKFYFVSFLYGFGPLSKIFLGVLFISLGFRVFGVMVGVFLSFLIPLVISSIVIFKEHKKEYRKKDSEKLLFNEFRKYSLKFFIATISIAVISSGDVILVRHFFNPVVSGEYAALSLIGKAIFWLSAPIYFVFFPLISYKREKKESVLGTLVLAGIVIAAISGAVSLVYFFVPHLVLLVFAATKYKNLSGYLGIFSLYIFIFSIAYLLNNFFLSIGKTSVYKIDLAVATLFIILVFLFHRSVPEIIGVLFFVSFLLLVSLLIYYKLYEAD